MRYLVVIAFLFLMGCGPSKAEIEAGKAKAKRDALVAAREDYELELKEEQRLVRESAEAIRMYGESSRDAIGSPLPEISRGMVETTKGLMEKTMAAADAQRKKTKAAKDKMESLSQ